MIVYLCKRLVLSVYFMRAGICALLLLSQSVSRVSPAPVFGSDLLHSGISMINGFGVKSISPKKSKTSHEIRQASIKIQGLSLSKRLESVSGPPPGLCSRVDFNLRPREGRKPGVFMNPRVTHKYCFLAWRERIESTHKTHNVGT